MHERLTGRRFGAMSTRQPAPAARNAGESKEVTSERVNMSVEILEKHYDAASVSEKAERRREVILDI